ncbi:nucleoid-associated protein [Petroclostridium sp. X23]|uniref:nucleoid-associated protein n=1 Tax=Petroclostridium sp. X23 TaxID=3045146 RepID=UPI0024ADB43B|nr:nucleoid-associated protein [Petroclostridium sp. X23]WHH60561.1 nucleoid-associated protein [Petroclostridium sp. X23]
MNDDISIKKMIVHILDNNLQMPVLSMREHPEDNETNEFIKKHIGKLFKDDHLKDAQFISIDNKVENLCQELANAQDQFIRITSEIGSILFDIMIKHVDIPSADLICCLFKAGNTTYLAILKFNYKHSFIHYIQSDESGTINSIIKQKTTLPGENQKVEEYALVNLNDFSIKLVEKKYEINGEKTFYFSDLFLKCTTKISTAEKVKLFTKATEKFQKQYFEEDYTKPVEIRKAVADSIEEKEVIDVMNVADNVFRQNPELKQEYLEEIRKTGLKDTMIEVSEKIAEKTFKRQKIKTDTGIEINLPVEYYGNKDRIEFINNPDGTISIVIKNIGKISDK